MKAFVIMGPESSGTRILTQILISAGCIGDGGHEQKFDDAIPPPSAVDAPIVWRRSVPHHEGEQMPVLDEMVEQLDGYDITVLITTRSLYPVAKSQMRHRETIENLKVAYERIQNGYRHIFKQVTKYDFMVVPYESLSQAKVKICEIVGLDAPDVEIYDANAKYFSS